ncbi:MAG: LysR family transcriptional regulator [Gammaproteobacteria bacterium]|nr:LysR family transcriptional regulator [Gammaproteobacteria bacterium]MCP5136926.1 LysR family transcriptional regulator [Gammaproteobacteria bacterium]
MHVTLRQLDVFDAVARHLSYTRAAEELHLSQPAVSMQIKQLEESTGIPLFEQLGKRIYLTVAGSELHRYARIIRQQLGEAEAVLEDLKGLRRGRLSVGVASTANNFAARLLARFVEDMEGVSFSLDVTNRETLLRQLENNERDLVIMGRPPKDADLDESAFMANPLVMIAPKGHPLAARQSIPLKELDGETFVVRECGSGTRIAVENLFDKCGVSLSTRLEMSTNEAIKQAVEAGLGLGVASMHTLGLELGSERLSVLNVEGFPIRRHWYVVHRKGKRLSPLAAAFKAFVLKEAGVFCGLLEASGRNGEPDRSWCGDCQQRCEI